LEAASGALQDSGQPSRGDITMVRAARAGDLDEGHWHGSMAARRRNQACSDTSRLAHQCRPPPGCAPAIRSAEPRRWKAPCPPSTTDARVVNRLLTDIPEPVARQWRWTQCATACATGGDHTMSTLTLGAAAKLAGVSKSTLTRAIKAGRMSAA